MLKSSSFLEENKETGMATRLGVICFVWLRALTAVSCFARCGRSVNLVPKLPSLSKPKVEHEWIRRITTSNATSVFSPTEFWHFVKTSDSSIPNHRHEGCFVMVQDKKAYLIGGRGTRPVDVYDPLSNTWKTKGFPPITMNHFQCVAVDDRVYIMNAWTGKYPKEKTVQYTYVYHTSNDTLTTEPALPLARRRGSTTAVLVQRNGTREIYVSHGNIGGHGNQSVTLNWFDKYNVDTRTWTTNLPDAPNIRDHAGGALLNGNLICVAGGRNGGAIDWQNAFIKATDCFNLDTNTWSVLPNIIGAGRAGSGVGVTCDGSYMIVAGGEGNGTAHADVSAFNGTHWILLPSLNQARHATQIATLCSPCESFYIASGSSIQGGSPRAELTSTEVYDPRGQELCQPGANSPSAKPSSRPLAFSSSKPSSRPIALSGSSSKPSSHPISASSKPSSKPSRSPTFTPYQIRINAGGNPYKDSLGNQWQGDQYFDTGYTFNRTKNILNTIDDLLYQTERSAKTNLTYNVPVPTSGTYRVDLLFCELYFSAVGKRVINAWVENTLVASSLDIFKTVGQYVPLVLSTNVSVVDGAVTIRLVPMVENPKISAMAILRTAR